MNSRGTIRNVLRKQQINDFSEILLGKITPTDIDAIIEYKDKAYVLIEIKYKDTKLPFGQKLALQRLTNDICKIKKAAIFLVVEHDIEDVSQSVNVSECMVREYFYNGRWYIPKKSINTISAINKFLRRFYG